MLADQEHLDDERRGSTERVAVVGAGSRSPSGTDQLPAIGLRLRRLLVELIGLGIVACGFATFVLAPWYLKVGGIPTVLMGIAVLWYPDPRDHLRLYQRSRSSARVSS